MGYVEGVFGVMEVKGCPVGGATLPSLCEYLSCARGNGNSLV